MPSLQCHQKEPERRVGENPTPKREPARSEKQRTAPPSVVQPWDTADDDDCPWEYGSPEKHKEEEDDDGGLDVEFEEDSHSLVEWYREHRD